MPKRTDIHKILLIGSGPITIGQACEFDYSGTQALKALREEGYEVVLVNSNPATIMTDPELSDRTYIEPLTLEFLEKLVDKEKPDALLPTMGGQTALNLAVQLWDHGALQSRGIKLIGASREAIHRAEDRQLFKDCMLAAGLDVPRSHVVTSVEQGRRAVEDLGYPIVLRPSFTLGGEGGGVAFTPEDFEKRLARALELSPVHSVLLEESILGWKEFELEVMRDSKDNCVIVCSIENLDPMGVHTGDSITVAPAQTLTDSQYQEMRNESLRVMRAIGVDTGGSNIQFGVNPKTGRRVVIEMNPRVSRSSALASKATGFPIAKIAAKLAVGYTLDEIPNDITRKTPACFEPSIDYVVTKVPRFAFEKFVGSERRLDTSMKSVGEAMAIGRTFKESLQKALRSLEIGRGGLENPETRRLTIAEWRQVLADPKPERIFAIAEALAAGVNAGEVAAASSVDPWFIAQIQEIVDLGREIKNSPLTPELMRRAKRMGFSDAQLARLKDTTEPRIRAQREKRGIHPAFKPVDTCAGEFEARTPYFYSTFEDFDEVKASGKKKKIAILGAGPNRIGQGIEFDYCCVHASLALKDMGIETVMINCNPETVSTDYDISDRLYFEPLTLEDVLHVLRKEKPLGVVAQFGGQTPLNLALPLAKAGVKILGTSPDSIDLAEDRERFGRLARKLKIPMPEHGVASNAAQALKVAKKIGYPAMVRPSFVLGGRAMEVVYDDAALEAYMAKAGAVSEGRPILIDRFLSDAVELDVDALCDGRKVFIAGFLEHIEEAGIHSGDSACSMPPQSLSPEQIATVVDLTRRLAMELKVVGLLNLQFAVQDGRVYLLEANPRASRTVPFVSKATGLPLARLAAQVIAGKKLDSLIPPGLWKHPFPPLAFTATKEVVIPFLRFPGVDPRLGPEMKSTGEVMGLDDDFGRSFAKSQSASGAPLPAKGSVFFSVKDSDKPAMLPVAKRLEGWGFTIYATTRTAEYLRASGVDAKPIHKLGEGKPDVVELIRERRIDLVINTPSGKKGRSDGFAIRRTALEAGIPQVSTPAAARAALRGIEAYRNGHPLGVRALQDYYRELPYRIQKG